MAEPLVPRSQIPAASILTHRRDPFQSNWPRGGTPGAGGPVVPHIFTVAGRYGMASKTYSVGDEALIDSRENAELMRNELAIMECLEARMRSTALLNWHITPYDDSLDERTKDVLKAANINNNRWDAQELAAKLSLILARTPNLTKLFYSLMDAIWYGRYASEQFFTPTTIQGISNRTMVIKRWEPRHGDKLIFRYDDGFYDHDPDQVGIRVGAGYAIQEEFLDWAGNSHRKVEPTQMGLAYFLDKAERRRMAVHKHIIEDSDFYNPLKAGSIHGIGIRSRIYWTWYAYSECLKLLLEYLERSALGIEIWRYPAHNPQAKQQATDAAQRRGAPGRSILMVPVPEGEAADLYDVQIVEPGLHGADVLQNVLDKYFGHKIKRYILGQTLTTEAGATGMGSGVAQAHQATYADIVRFDSLGLAETITHDIVRVLQLINFPGSHGIWLRFQFDTESPLMEYKLSAYRQAWEMGASIRTDDIFNLLGAAKPHENDETLINPMLHQNILGLEMMTQQAEMQKQQMAMGMAAAQGPPGSEGADPANAQEMMAPMQLSAFSNEPLLDVKPRDASIQRFECNLNPSEAQIKAGNYKKKKLNWKGFRISIENPAGSVRKGKDWEFEVKHDYGYIRGTKGNDGDQIDCFVGPNMESELIFVIDQVKKGGRKFDEHKCIIGATNKAQAKQIYLSCYPKGKKCGDITSMTLDQFRKWLENGDHRKRVSQQVSQYSVDYVANLIESEKQKFNLED